MTVGDLTPLWRDSADPAKPGRCARASSRGSGRQRAPHPLALAIRRRAGLATRAGHAGVRGGLHHARRRPLAASASEVRALAARPTGGRLQLRSTRTVLNRVEERGGAYLSEVTMASFEHRSGRIPPRVE